MAIGFSASGKGILKKVPDSRHFFEWIVERRCGAASG